MPEIKLTVRGRSKPRARKAKVRSPVVEGAVREMGLNPLEFLMRLNGEFVPDTARLRKGDRLELLEITSRG